MLKYKEKKWKTSNYFFSTYFEDNLNIIRNLLRFEYKKLKCNEIVHEHGYTAAEKLFFFAAAFIENEPILFLCNQFDARKYIFPEKKKSQTLYRLQILRTL